MDDDGAAVRIAVLVDRERASARCVDSLGHGGQLTSPVARGRVRPSAAAEPAVGERRRRPAGVERRSGWCRAARARRSGRARSSVSSTSAAPSWLSRCSIVRGPMIGAVTAGCRRTKASASSISVRPASSARTASCSTTSSLRWFSGSERSKRAGIRSARTAGRLDAFAVAARQPAARQRAPRDHGHAVALADRQHVGLDRRGRGSSTAAARRRSARGRAARRSTAPRRSARPGTSTSRSNGSCPRGRGR